MSKTVLIVHAHPEPTSLTGQMAQLADDVLSREGHEVLRSDLYAMGWSPALSEADFPDRQDPTVLKLVPESYHAYTNSRLAADVAAEHEKLMSADLLILQFPLWWFGMPAILKGWVDRVWTQGLANNFKGAGNQFRYGEGGLSGRRAMVSVTTGSPSLDYGPRGIHGHLDELLFPITHGILFSPGMQVLETQATLGTGRMGPDGIEAAKRNWAERLVNVFAEQPIAYRTQNGGDYKDRHELGSHILPGETGLGIHFG